MARQWFNDQDLPTSFLFGLGVSIRSGKKVAMIWIATKVLVASPEARRDDAGNDDDGGQHRKHDPSSPEAAPDRGSMSAGGRRRGESDEQGGGNITEASKRLHRWPSRSKSRTRYQNSGYSCFNFFRGRRAGAMSGLPHVAL